MKRLIVTVEDDYNILTQDFLHHTPLNGKRIRLNAEYLPDAKNSLYVTLTNVIKVEEERLNSQKIENDTTLTENRPVFTKQSIVKLTRKTNPEQVYIRTVINVII
jgi:hypothetical protein